MIDFYPLQLLHVKYSALLLLQSLKGQVMVTKRILNISEIELVGNCLPSTSISIELRGNAGLVKCCILITLKKVLPSF